MLASRKGGGNREMSNAQDQEEIQYWIDRIEIGAERAGSCLMGSKEATKMVDILRRAKSDRLKITFMARHSAKLVGLDIDQVDAKALKELLGEKWTNGDRIRSMRNEEVAKELLHHDCKRHCKNYNANVYTGSTCLTTESCSKGIIKWLESEAEI
jgi:hypothetical protein